MSIMYDEVPGRPRWQDIAVHDDKFVKGFFGEYRFLSNFAPCYLPSGYPTSENAYMAAKVRTEHRAFFRECTAREAKTEWKNFPLIDKSAAEWDARKYQVMAEILLQKFDPTLNPELHVKLKATGNRYLEEKNWWSDSVWGVDWKKGGQNLLGRLLMDIRDGRLTMENLSLFTHPAC